jgi:hypothetical protein
MPPPGDSLRTIAQGADRQGDAEASTTSTQFEYDIFVSYRRIDGTPVARCYVGIC